VSEHQGPPTDLEQRFLTAWRASGLAFGKFVVAAANVYGFGAAVSLPGICDEALVEMCERYVRERSTPSTEEFLRRDPETVAPREPAAMVHLRVGTGSACGIFLDGDVEGVSEDLAAVTCQLCVEHDARFSVRVSQAWGKP
jgi:hypothetical protein